MLDYIEHGKITDEYTKQLQHQVDILKHDEDWRDRYMTLEMKMDEKYEQGLAAGRSETLTNQVRKKLQKGKPLSVIAEECEEDESVIQEIIASMNEDYLAL